VLRTGDPVPRWAARVLGGCCEARAAAVSDIGQRDTASGGVSWSPVGNIYLIIFIIFFINFVLLDYVFYQIYCL
jgi:hypothetical protein